MKLPPFDREYVFAAELGRRWRFDFAFVEFKAALEVEGLVCRRIKGQLIMGGRHATPEGFKADNLKYARAAIMGWFVLRFEQTQVHDGTAIDHIIDLLRVRGWK